MNIPFSVNSPKLDKRKTNRGEDAPAVNKDGIMIICDGTGATGQTEHILGGQTYTSAYLGSRQTSVIAEKFLTEHYESLMNAFTDPHRLNGIIARLAQAIGEGLADFIWENKLTRTVHGRSFKLLPTTFTAVLYKTAQTKVEAIVLCAGDSRALWWDAAGLHQLSIEDSDNQDRSVGDCSVSNCVSADGEFSISFSCHTLPSKGVLLATSDGFTDPVKPFEQERYLIEWIGNFDGVTVENATRLSAAIAGKLDEIGFTKRDDCSMAGLIVGYDSEQELKDDFFRRYKGELIENYLKPYRNFNSQFTQAEARQSAAKHALQGKEEQIVPVIKDGIRQYLQTSDGQLDMPAFQALIRTDAISREIMQADSSIEQDRQEKRTLWEQKETALKEGYLEFLIALCREYGDVRFSEELIAAVQVFCEKEEILDQCRGQIKNSLDTLPMLESAGDEICSETFLDEIESLSEELHAAATLAKSHCADYQAGKRVVEGYFTYENEEIAAFLREDLADGFAILKKIPAPMLLGSKKRSELKAAGRYLLDLHKTAETLKAETEESVIQDRKMAAYTGIILNSCGMIARELFRCDKFWEFLPEETGKQELPELKQYKDSLDELLALIARRDQIWENYNGQYGKYLSHAQMKGKVWFRKEAQEQHADH